jgi:transposase
MTIPGVGQLTALAFVAEIDGPDRFRTSRYVGPYLGLVPRRWKSGEIDYTGSISKCGDRRVRTVERSADAQTRANTLYLETATGVNVQSF